MMFWLLVSCYWSSLCHDDRHHGWDVLDGLKQEEARLYLVLIRNALDVSLLISENTQWLASYRSLTTLQMKPEKRGVKDTA